MRYRQVIWKERKRNRKSWFDLVDFHRPSLRAQTMWLSLYLASLAQLQSHYKRHSKYRWELLRQLVHFDESLDVEPTGNCWSFCRVWIEMSMVDDAVHCWWKASKRFFALESENQSRMTHRVTKYDRKTYFFAGKLMLTSRNCGIHLTIRSVNTFCSCASDW